MARKVTMTAKKDTRKVNWNENAFDALAKAAPTAQSRTSKPIVEVTDAIRKTVDKYLKAKNSAAKAKADLEQCGDAIIEHVREQQDKNAFAGNFSKSYEVPGTGENKIAFVASDKFSVAQEDEVHDSIKDLVGKDNYPLVVKKIRTITMNEKMQENEEFINNLIKTLQDAGLSLADAFEVKDKLVVVKGMDETQYNLVPNTKLPEFRTLVKQAKPSLK